MRAEDFVSRLAKARKTGPGRWVACCPAHEDDHPSFTIREIEDGRILVHCFGGCNVEEVVAAVGVSLSDLFPEKLIDYARPERKPFRAEDVMKCVEMEMQIVALCAADMAAGKSLSDTDRKRLALANSRLAEATRLSLGEL